MITLETQKCRKKAPRSVEFNFFINCDRRKRFSQNEKRRADLQNVASLFKNYTFYVQNWSMRLLSGMAIFLSEIPWPLNVSRQPLPAPSFAPPSVHLRRTCLNNSTGRHYAGAEKSPAWPSFINFYSLVIPLLTLASSPLHRRSWSVVAPCGNHTNLSCPKHIPVNTSTHFSTGHH